MTLHVGIDLAWGERARSGIAVADDEGRLLASTSVVGDGDIAAFVSSYDDGGPLVAAIDAPLVVANLTGRRPCEALVQREFGRFHAGPYPSNLSLPAFASGVRGARLCERFGWRLDLVAPAASRRAVEVYPHPALVVLLGLDRVLPYKGKSGRSLEVRRSAFLRLLEGLAAWAPLDVERSSRWPELCQAVDGAVRPSQLDAVEDEVDAIVCAHLAWWWSAHPERMAVYGDDASGAIVVPATRALPSGAAAG